MSSENGKCTIARYQTSIRSLLKHHGSRAGRGGPGSAEGLGLVGVEGEGRWLGVEGVDGLLFAHCECVKGVWGLGWLIVNGLNGLDGRSGTEFRAFL